MQWPQDKDVLGYLRFEDRTVEVVRRKLVNLAVMRKPDEFRLLLASKYEALEQMMRTM